MLAVSFIVASSEMAAAGCRTNAFSSPDSPFGQHFGCDDGSYGRIRENSIGGPRIEMHYPDGGFETFGRVARSPSQIAMEGSTSGVTWAPS